MPNSPFTAPLSMTVKSSFQKWLIVSLPHLVAFILILLIDVFTLEIKTILILLIVASFIYNARLHIFLSLNKSVTSIHQDSAKNWTIISNKVNKKEVISASLLPSSFVSKVLLVLNYRDSVGSRHSILVTPDSLSSNEFRRLRVRLNYFNTKKE